MDLLVYVRDSKGVRDCEYLAKERIGGLSLVERAILSAKRGGYERFGLMVPSGYVLDKGLSNFEGLEIFEYGEGEDELVFIRKFLNGNMAEELVGVYFVDGMGDKGFFSSSLCESEGRVFVDGEGSPLYFVRSDRFFEELFWVNLKGGESSVIVDKHFYDGGIYQKVSDVRDMRLAQDKLTASLRKPLGRDSDGMIAYFINRRISLQISRLIVNTFISPNMITVLGLLMGLGAGLLISRGEYLWMVMGGVLWQLSSIIDGVDGELARMRYQSSHAGEWFDSVCDDIVNLFVLSCLGYAASRIEGDIFYFHLAVGVAVGTAMVLLWFYREFVRLGIASHNHYSWGFEKELADEKEVLKDKGIIRVLLDRVAQGFSWICKRDFYTFLFMVLLILNLPMLSYFMMLGATSIISVGGIISLSLNTYRRLRQSKMEG